MSRLKINVVEAEGSSAFRPYEINGYLISKPLTTDNSGFSKWGFCTKNGTEFFIKEFVNPVYPSEKVELAQDIREKKINICMQWYNTKKKMYETILRSQTGNLIVPTAFFRNDSHFYLVTDKVEKSELDHKVICTFELKRKMILLKVLSSSFAKLEANGVVHADIKLDNLLIKETKNGFMTVKVIDFDASYLEEEPPFGDEIQGDPVYYAPETFLAIMEEPVKLTTKVDVFALGIVFHQLLCGDFPKFDREYDYVYEAVLNDDELTLDENIPECLQDMIRRMLEKEAEKRVSIAEVFRLLCEAEKTLDLGKPSEGGTSAGTTAAKRSVASRWKIPSDFD